MISWKENCGRRLSGLSLPSTQAEGLIPRVFSTVCLPESRFSLYMLTHRGYKKVRNIMQNPSVSFVVPFPHHYLRFVPSSCVQFQGTAQIVPFNNRDAQKAFTRKRILRMMIKQADQLYSKKEMIFIRIKPNGKIFCYGLGYGIMELRRNLENAGYPVTVPPERL